VNSLLVLSASGSNPSRGARLVRALVLVGRGFRGEAITLRACALTYLTLFALVPLLAVLYSVLDLVSGEAQLHDRVQTYVNSQLGIGAGAAIAAALTTFTSKATVKTLGAIGFAVLLFSALSLLWKHRERVQPHLRGEEAALARAAAAQILVPSSLWAPSCSACPST